MRQLIIARKDLNMSPGKLAAQCAHASIAFLSQMIRESTITGTDYDTNSDYSSSSASVDDDVVFFIEGEVREDVLEDWLKGIFTKTICQARNCSQLLKAKEMAEEMGMKEGYDFFLIKDNCLTELEPEEVDEKGVGRVLTCIGFRPLPDEVTHQISRKFHLYV